MALSVAAQQPEKVIGAPIDTSGFLIRDDSKVMPPVITLPPERLAIHRDSVQPHKHSPKTATILSLVVPGAGQVYNRKNWWWKVPIIYGGGTALVYGAVFYQRNYRDFKNAYRFTQTSPDKLTGNPRFDQYSDATLRSIRNSYKEARDQCIIGIGLLYALQVVDAAVEAHFFDFNVNEDLSLNIQPQMVLAGPNSYTGVQFTFRLK